LIEKSKYSLLYVEDELAVREIVLEYLEEFFSDVYEASNGVEALKIYNNKKPDVIISDIEMPKMNGLKLASLIRKKDITTPIIITTAYTSVEYLLEATELNLIKYLVKPVEESKLEKALKICFERIESSCPSVVALTNKHFYDTFNSTLSYEGKLIALSTSQIQLLSLLIKNRNRAVTYVEIENHIWYNKVMSEAALRSLVYDTRQLISKEVIENVSRTGYKIKLYE
jgi:DNA-binding response OmpR family regulator